MWSTSNRPRRTSCTARTAGPGPSAIGATEPLDGTGSDRPSRMRASAGRPSSSTSPSTGASTAASWPPARKARASPRTWPWTPPGFERLYGQSSATRIAAGGSGGGAVARRVRSGHRNGGARVGGPVRGRGEVARPVGLEEMPLVGRAPDEAGEVVGDQLGDAGHVVTQLAGPHDLHRRHDDRHVVPAGAAVHRGGEDGRTRAKREQRGPAGHRHALAEELDLHPGPGEVTVAQEPHELAGAQRPQERRAGVGPERHDGESHRGALGDEQSYISGGSRG